MADTVTCSGCYGSLHRSDAYLFNSTASHLCAGCHAEPYSSLLDVLSYNVKLHTDDSEHDYKVLLEFTELFVEQSSAYDFSLVYSDLLRVKPDDTDRYDRLSGYVQRIAEYMEGDVTSQHVNSCFIALVFVNKSYGEDARLYERWKLEVEEC